MHKMLLQYNFWLHTQEVQWQRMYGLKRRVHVFMSLTYHQDYTRKHFDHKDVESEPCRRYARDIFLILITNDKRGL